jgi:hypothetical protein
MALDGLILREPGRRGMGIALRWLPVLFGVLVSVAGLSAVLEARYRLVHGDDGADLEAASPPLD